MKRTGRHRSGAHAKKRRARIARRLRRPSTMLVPKREWDAMAEMWSNILSVPPAVVEGQHYYATIDETTSFSKEEWATALNVVRPKPKG